MWRHDPRPAGQLRDATAGLRREWLARTLLFSGVEAREHKSPALQEEDMSFTNPGLAATAAAIAATVALASGCAHQAAAPEAQTPISQTTTTSSGPAPAPTGSRNDVVVSDDLLRACKVDLGNVAEAPKFDFDQSDVRPSDRSVLDQIAKCVTTGPLSGRSLHLVGRADPRGEQEYNMTLGSSRAEAVARYLRSLGVATNQLSETSRGKLDAMGTDEASWQLDRRVDIQ
jgi:peptidoglycan-associated lipoprotein